MICKLMPLCLTALFLIAGCVQDMELVEKGDRDASRKVLIAGSKSEFKLSIVRMVIEILGTENYYFKVVGLDRLKKENTGAYGAILLVNAYMAGRMDGRITEFLKSDPADPRVIVFFTRGTDDPMPDWAKPKIQVDAIASASAFGRVGERAEQLAALIEKRF